MQMAAGQTGSVNPASSPSAGGVMQAHLQSYNKAFSPPKAATPRVTTPKSTSYSGSPSGTYIVKSGDTLSGIAANHGVHWGDLASWNNLSDPNALSVGQKLNLYGSKSTHSSAPKAPTSHSTSSGSALPVAHKSAPSVPTNNAVHNPASSGIQDATLADVAKKYGIDLSQGYANSQAAAQFKGQQDSLNNSLSLDKADYNTQLQALLNSYNQQQDSINQESTQNQNLNAQNLKAIADTLNSGLASTDQSYFLKGLDNAQQLENNGINAGLASDSNLRLAMNKQNAVGALDNTASQQKGAESNRYSQQVTALANALRQANADYSTQQQGAYNTYTGQTKDLQSKLADLPQQQAAAAQSIKQNQLAAALAQLNTTNSRNDANNQFNQSQAWQKYTYTHMSAQEKAQFDQNAKQYGQTMAWNIEQQKQQIASANSAYAGFNSGSGGGGSSYQSDLAKASQIVNMDPSQLGAFNWIIQHESSDNPNAQNKTSTAHGYAQFLNSTQAEYDKKMGLNYNSSGANQLAEAYQYMVDRYGSPQAAQKFWSEHHWY